MAVQFHRTMLLAACERGLVSGQVKFPSPLPIPPPPSEGGGWAFAAENVIPGPQPMTFLFVWLWTRESFELAEPPDRQPSEEMQ